jgi:hypothetical protein
LARIVSADERRLGEAVALYERAVQQPEVAAQP